MISIIISTYRQEYFAKLEKSIIQTIGVPFEIIKIENSGLMGIAAAYNKGIPLANFNFLCFCHEDILFHTKDWGKKVLDIFANNSKIGLLGIAGNLYKSITPSHWSFETANKNSFYVNVLHSSDKNKTTAFYSNPKNCALQQVATIDGLWFCTPKKVVEEFPFDQETCPGFHGYDVDYSLSVQKKYKVAVTFEILIQHYSIGNFNTDWIDSLIKVHEKWKNNLPLLVENFDGFDQKNEEKKALNFFSKLMLDNHYSVYKVLSLYRFYNRNFKFSMREFISILYPLIRYKYAVKVNIYKNRLYQKLHWRSSEV